MFSNPHSFLSSEGFNSDEGTHSVEEGLGERVLGSIRQAFCGLHGHDTLLQFDRDRMFLKCVSCGHESPGWSINEPSPTVTVRGTISVRGDDRHQSLARQSLFGARRMA